MSSLASHSLSRTCSLSSLGSDDSVATAGDTPAHSAIKRTRKRFTTVQLLMLEHLYRKACHPTREQREQVAKDADIDIRSVTVWFQNKRQTDRRLHRQLSEAPSGSQPSVSPSPLSSSPSPFSDASGNTIHTVRARARTRTLSGTSSTSAVSRKRERERDAQDLLHPLGRHVRHKPSRHLSLSLSLDDVAARAERPALLPRALPQPVISSPPPSSSPSLSSLFSFPSSPARSTTPEPKPITAAAGGAEDDDARDGQRALWENMPSSPAAPTSRPERERERDIVRYGGRRRITLEYACAREIVGFSVRGMERERERERERDGRPRMRGGRERERREDKTRYGRHRGADVERKRAVVDHDCVPGEVKEEEEDVDDIPVADYDDDVPGGDTDTEGAPTEPPMTPSSSFALGEFRAMSMGDDDEGNNMTVQEKVFGKPANKVEPMAVQVEVAPSGPDDDLLDVAYVLCGLRQRR